MRAGEPLADEEDALALSVQAGEVRGNGIQRRHRDLGPHRLGPLGVSGNVVAFESIARRVLAFAPFERADGCQQGVTVPREPDAQDRVERLQHDHEVAGGEIAPDELRQRFAHSSGALGRDVVFVEEDREKARAVAGGFRSLVGLGRDRPWPIAALALRAHEPDAVDRQLNAAFLLDELEIGGRQAADDAARRIAHDRIDPDGSVDCWSGEDPGTGAHRERDHDRGAHHVSSSRGSRPAPWLPHPRRWP